MQILALVLVALAALLHVVIFAMESILWTRPAVWRRFGLTSQEAADSTRAMAYNQGFYNLFLAIVAAVGVVLDVAQNPAGFVLMVVATASMVAAAVVLTTTGSGYLRAALTQGTVPALALAAVLLS